LTVPYGRSTLDHVVALQVEPLSRPASDWAAYLAHFGLREPPFAITPDPRYLFLAERHREALALLLYGVGAAGGLVQLTGEVGTGKTTLCRALLDRVPPHVDVALVLNPTLTAPELLATVCDELHITYPPATASIKVLVDALYRYLLEAHAAGRRTVLVIDEAQNLTAEVLEQLRLLTNLETARDKLLQIILIGQPELAQLLERKNLRQVAQRITARYHLTPFSEPETRACVVHRLQVAGQSAAIFTDGALRDVHRLSGGVPRLVNVICDRALLGAFGHDLLQIDRGIVRAATREVLGRPGGPGLSRRVAWMGALVAVAAMAIAAAVLARPHLRDVEFPFRGWDAGPASSPAVARASTAPGGSEPPVAGASSQVDTRSRADAIAAGPRAAKDETPLAVLLDSGAGTADARSAFKTLYARWGIEADREGAAVGCEQARAYGLRCLSRRGDWSGLFGFDLPAILELQGPTGQRRHGVVVARSVDDVTIALGDRQWRGPTTAVDPYWRGTFVLLWRPPALGTLPLALGFHGHDVEALRERLAQVDGKGAGQQNGSLYDDELRRRVIAFQRSRSLPPDGVVGEDTLAHLVTATAGPTVPVLSSGASQ
jgi:general secretion pathway protein A